MIHRLGPPVLVVGLVIGPAVPSWGGVAKIRPAARPVILFQASEEPPAEPTPPPTATPSREPSPTEEPSPEPSPTEEPSPEPPSTQLPSPTQPPSPTQAPTPPETPTSAAAPADAPTVWQWVLLGILVVGALAALAAARRRHPDPTAARQNLNVLLAQLQEIATRARTNAPTDEEIAYEVAVLDALEPLLVDAIPRERDEATRLMLEGIRSDLRDLRRTLRDARRTAIRSENRARVAVVAGTLSADLRRLREAVGGVRD